MSEPLRLSAVQSPIIPVIADLIRAHPGTISLGQGVVHYGPPPAAFARLESFAADSANHKYQSVAGLPVLLESIAGKMAAENAVRIGGENRAMVTVGGNQGFFNAVLAIADPGDEFILPTPCYFNQEMAVTMASCRPVLVPTDAHHQLQLDRLRAAITPRTRAIITVSPQQPDRCGLSGSRLARSEPALQRTRHLSHSRRGLRILHLRRGPALFPASIAGSAAHTISLFSLSKAYGFASWRIGWMVFPADLESAMRKIQDTVLICPTVISQFAALGALEAGAAYVREKLRGIAEVRALVRSELSGLSDICDVPPAQGAFYFLLRVRADRPSLEMAERLIREHRVAAIPGNAFGLDHGCHLRVAYGALQPDTAAEGMARLARGLRALT